MIATDFEYEQDDNDEEANWLRKTEDLANWLRKTGKMQQLPVLMDDYKKKKENGGLDESLFEDISNSGEGEGEGEEVIPNKETRGGKKKKRKTKRKRIKSTKSKRRKTRNGRK